MQGGGFRAQMSDLGVIAGLLAFTGSCELADSPILRGYDTVSTVSGSSWFGASLIYSPSFVNLLEGMAKDPSSAAELFHERWVVPWLAVANQDSPFVRILAEAVALFDKGLAEDIALLGYIYKDGGSWQKAVETLLETTANIKPQTPMGSETCQWASGKTWICNATVLTPTTSEEAVNIWQRGLIEQSSATYMLKDAAAPAGSVPKFTPARFSITLGTQDAAPLPFISPEGLSHSAELEYTGTERERKFCAKAEVFTGASEAIDGFPTAQATVAAMPIAGPVAASSAAFGKLVAESKVSLELQRLQLCPWFSNAGGADAFANATSLVQQIFEAETVTQRNVDDLAKLEFRGLTDAGDSDVTGLLNAISVNCGCDEVTVVLNEATNATLPHTVLRMFPGYKPNCSLDVMTPPKPILYPQSGIFASPSSAAVEDAWASDQGFFEVPALKTAKYFLGLKAGTIRAVTNESKWFNIVEDVDVVINVVSIASNVTIGQLEDFDKYGVLAQEIIEAILDSGVHDVVRKKLLPMFSA